VRNPPHLQLLEANWHGEIRMWKDASKFAQHVQWRYLEPCGLKGDREKRASAASEPKVIRLDEQHAVAGRADHRASLRPNYP
jgi:hypothetical protein